MNAQALICDETRTFSLSDVDLPDPGPDHLAGFRLDDDVRDPGWA